MLHILPRIKYSITSPKSPEDIKAALEAATVSEKTFGVDTLRCAGGEFIGEVNLSDFKIVKKPRYFRSSFWPVIVGTVRTENGTSVIDIKMRLLLFTYILCIIVFGMLGLLVLLMFLSCLIDRTWESVKELLGIAAGLGLFWLMVNGGFYIPAKSHLKRLEELIG
ncbi:MAG: hypothetical protein NC321_01300 [Clostridium sp.]|nr:hypothetical protein [Clostridium sp.]